MRSDASACDIVLRGGTLIDGSGGAAYTADVAVRGDRIVEMGKLDAITAAHEIDASGLIVAPGFIDVHTHDDAAVVARPEMLPKLTQGVTTVIGGNCGISAAPYDAPADPRDLMRLIFKSNRFVAPTFEAYLSKVRNATPAINSAFLTGHSTLRMRVMGSDLNRAATRHECAQMRDLLTQCLDEGSLGLSTGLFYSPARSSSAEEIIEVARPLRDYQGVYATHMRDEGDQVIQSIEESLTVARAVDAPLIISHHKCMGPKNFGRSIETLSRIERAARSQPIALDVYPYTASSTVLLPEMVDSSLKTLVAWSEPRPEFNGWDLADIARSLGCTLLEAVPKLLPAGAIYFTMDEADVIRIMRSPRTMIGSDGLPEDRHPHPRLWGTFPRVLGHYVRERKVLALEEAVHRMTGLSAARFGFRNRGQIAPGKYADICVFDPRTVLDSATFEKPVSPAVGIRWVVVNGQVALKEGISTGIRAGKVLRRGDLADTSDVIC